MLGCTADGEPRSPGDAGGVDAPTDSGARCAVGVMRCRESSLERCTDGRFTLVETCPEACHATLGCVACTPSTATADCGTNTSRVCRSDGTGYDEVFCDPQQGMTCNPDSGFCEGACAPRLLGQSYIGCEYYATITANLLRVTDFPFAVAVSNASGEPASVTIDGGALTAPLVFDVPPNEVRTQDLPWIFELKICPPSDFVGICNDPPADGALVEDGAYRLRSTRPVTVYQFNPLPYTDGAGRFSYTNDASLLLPTNVWTGNYVVGSWPPRPSGDARYPSLFAIVPARDATRVTITARAAAGAGALGMLTAGAHRRP
jgi:hypothetical protein